MPSDAKPPQDYLEALRACRAHPEGLRRDAYPSAMPSLVELGYVQERHVRVPGRSTPMWFLTTAGRELIRSYETREPT